MEVYSKRKQLEAKVATVEAKYTTTSEKNAKMKEAMKVAEQKVAQTQAQVQMFEQLNDEKRARIADLNRKIAEEEEKKQKQLYVEQSHSQTTDSPQWSGNETIECIFRQWMNSIGSIHNLS